MNNVWYGVNTVNVTADKLDKPMIIPSTIENSVPAHIGHAVNRPDKAPPTAPRHDVLLFLLFLMELC